MQALKLPARRGWRWLAEGFVIYRDKPMMLSLFVPGLWFLILYIKALPLIGPFVATLLFPVFSVVFMNVCRMAAQGTPPNVTSLLIGLDRRNLRAMLVLGGIYLICTLCIVAVLLWLDDGVLREMLVSGKRPSDQVLAQSNFVFVVEIAFVMVTAVAVVYWYAPVLVAWHNLPAGKALFFSLVACARNWRAFLVYVLATIVSVNLLGVFLGILAAVLAGAGDRFLVVFALLLSVILLPTLYASFYVSYRDVFVIVDEDA